MHEEPIDPKLLGSLEGAVAASPDDIALRLHLASLLTDGGLGERALLHLGKVLEVIPDHAEALSLASRAAELTGDLDKAAGYRRLADSVKGPAPSNGERPAPDRIGEVSGAEMTFGQDWSRSGDFEIETPQLSLWDVGGLEEVKERIRTSFLLPMANPELRKMYGKSLRGGLLLYGPPGCGKTFLARALAGEMGAAFFPIELHEVLDMWLGQSEKNLHEVFQTARRNAPCILFLDEVDAIGQKRSHRRFSGERNVVVQLLDELDGLDSNNEGVFVVGASNHPWDIDTALRRPGRFDRMLLVLPPDKPARIAILKYHLRDRYVAKIDLEKFADRTDGASGADLRLLCESAAERALRDSLTRETPRPIENTDFQESLKELRLSTLAWFEMARNYVQFASEGGTYDDLLAYMRGKRLM